MTVVKVHENGKTKNLGVPDEAVLQVEFDGNGAVGRRGCGY